MNAHHLTTALFLVAGLATPVTTGSAQESAADVFGSATAGVADQLAEAMAELDALRETIAAEKIPLSRELSALEAELAAARAEYQKAVRKVDSRALDLSNLTADTKLRKDELAYVAGLLGDYIRNFESRLHIAELPRYEDSLEAARLAPGNDNLSEADVFEAQAAVLGLSIERLVEGLGGTSFEGTAVDTNGIVRQGTFLVVGPAALFRSNDGTVVGSVEQRIGSLEPSVIPFASPEDTTAASELVASGAGSFPLDPTLGNAAKIEATSETFLEHVKKGGKVMIPIFAMAGLALLIALYKWISFLLVRSPSKRRIAALLDAIGRSDEQGAKDEVGRIRGPVGAMLTTGVEHLREPRELIEEVMYEHVLTTRLRLQRLLPFIAICAASAPLLGLLGTVTGIINTFKMITVFGSGDVKSLSGGISEALITTKFGLIVAIPSLLLHAFLSRKVRGVIGQMEAIAISFLNQVRKSAFGGSQGLTDGAGRDRDPDVVPASFPPDEELERATAGVGAGSDVRTQVREALGDLLMPVVRARVEPPLKDEPKSHIS